MDYNLKPSVSGDELEELVLLAENVAHNIKILNNKLFKARMSQYVAMVFAYGSVFGIIIAFRYGYRGTEDSLTLGVIVGAILILSLGLVGAFYNIREAGAFRREIRVEQKVLARLMDMIPELHKITPGELGNVRHALIEMRLSRIRFSLSSE